MSYNSQLSFGVSSALIIDGTVVNADISSSAAIAASKIAGLAASATVDTTNASNITSGTLDAARVATLNQNTTGTAANVTGTVAIANGGTGATTATAALTNLGAYAASNPSGYTTNTGTVTGVGGTGTVSGLTLSGTVTTTGNLTLGGTLAIAASSITSGTIDAARLPSYVDDVLEAANLASFPVTGDAGKIYVALDTNKTYRWSGSAYVYITSGAVDSVAGKTGIVALVKADVGLGNVDNTSDADKPVSTAQQTALNTKQATLVSGTTIKTINSQSILGSGNIQIDGGVTSFNTRTGAVTLGSGDVTGALAYTPVNKAGDTITGDLFNSAAYSAPNNASGAGTKLLVRGSTGTGAAGASGGHGHVEILGGGATTLWTDFVGALARSRRGGVLVQAGTAQGDAGNTYVHGSALELYAGNGTNNGTTEGWGGQVVLRAGQSARTDGEISTGGGLTFNEGRPTQSGSFGISGGVLSFGSDFASSQSAGLSGSAATITQAGELNLNAGSYSTGGAQSYTSNSGAFIRLLGSTATTGGDILLYPGTVYSGIAGGVNGTVKVGTNIVLHAGNYSSYALPLAGGSLTGAVTSAGTYASTNNANVDGSNFIVDTSNKSLALYAYEVRRSGSTVGGILLGGAGAFATGTTVGGNTVLHAGNYTTYPVTEWYHSGRDFISGTLITTSIDYSGSSGDPFVLQIKGNSYGSGTPFDIQIQGYIYANTIINYGGYSTGPNFTIIAMNVGGKLCFWFARQAYWQGFNVNCYTAYGTRAINKVESITDVANPGGTKQVSITPSQVLRSDNYTNYSPSLTGSGASGTWGISISGSAATATTQAEKTINTSIATTAFVDRLRSLSTPTTGTTGTLVVGDRGALVQAAGAITVPANIFVAGDVVTVANNSASSITITQGASLTMYLVGTATTGNRTLAQRGVVTIVFLSATSAIISGGGVT